MKKRNRGSVEGEKAPYLRTSFWMKPENHWLEEPVIGENTKKRYRKMVQKMFEKHRNTATI
jgi:hypothetical protein